MSLPLLVFDVNETLLDLDALAPHFERMFGDRGILREWFAQLILYSEAITLSDNYAPFGELGAAVLNMLAVSRGVRIGEEDIQALQEAVATMPPEVPGALARLRKAGFRLFTLTNNPKATCARQIERAGMSRPFEGQFSVDDGAHRYSNQHLMRPHSDSHRVSRFVSYRPSSIFIIEADARRSRRRCTDDVSGGT
jgi:2-haloacid dehalogenase